MTLFSTINVSRSDHASWLPTEYLRDYLTPLLVWVGSISDKEKKMAPHSSTLAWKIPSTEEPGMLQSMGSLRVGHD